MNLTQIIISLISGGAAGAVFSFTVNCWMAAWTRKQLHAKLTIGDPVLHAGSLTLRIRNGYVIPLTNCWAYLTLDDYQPTDIIQPPNASWQAFITPQAPLMVREDRLCWSLSPIKPIADIYAGERQSLLLAAVPPNRDWIGIYSETLMSPFRVFLRGGAKCYDGTLKVVSKDTMAKEFRIRIDLRDREFSKNLLVAA